MDGDVSRLASGVFVSMLVLLSRLQHMFMSLINNSSGGRSGETNRRTVFSFGFCPWCSHIIPFSLNGGKSPRSYRGLNIQ